MSELTDWKSLGDRAQRDAAAQAEQRSAAEKAKELREQQEKQQFQIDFMIALGKLQELKAECIRVCNEFNSVIQDSSLKLTVLGGSPNFFSVIKGYGSESVKFEAEPNRIEVTSDRPGSKMGGTMEAYGIEDGKFTIRNGSGMITAERIVDYAIKRLIPPHIAS